MTSTESGPGRRRRGTLIAACRNLVAHQVGDLRLRTWHSPLPWLLLATVALAACLWGGATIALNIGDGISSAFLGVVGLALALVALRHLSRRLAAAAARVAGVLLIAEGFAVVWLGHEGGIEIDVGVALLALGLIRPIVQAVRIRRPFTAVSTLLLYAGAALVLASVLGIAGEYLDYRLNAGGFDCLEGFASAPDSYPGAPADPGSIRTGFSWNPLGRTCSWGPDVPAVINGETTAAATNLQTDQVTSDWIYRLGGSGLVALGIGAGVGLVDARIRLPAARSRRR